MPNDPSISKDFPIDAGIFTTAKVSLSASTDAAAALAIVNHKPFPSGDIQLGHISVTADTGSVSLKPSAIPAGTSVTFDIAASAQSGIGVYDKSSDAGVTTTRAAKSRMSRKDNSADSTTVRRIDEGHRQRSIIPVGSDLSEFSRGTLTQQFEFRPWVRLLA